jgi:peroxiredoxin
VWLAPFSRRSGGDAAAKVSIMNIKPDARRGRLLISLVVGLVVLLGRAFGANEAREAKPAPLFTFKDERGRVIKLTDFKAKPLLVCFLATWDKHSQKQMEILNDLLKQYSETNFAVLVLALDQTGSQSIKAYAEQQHLDYPLYVATYEMIQAFGGLTAIPTTFVIDKNQNIIQKYVGVTETNVLDADVKAITKQ